MVSLVELIDVDYKIKVDSRGKYKAHTDDQLIIAVRLQRKNQPGFSAEIVRNSDSEHGKDGTTGY